MPNSAPLGRLAALLALVVAACLATLAAPAAAQPATTTATVPGDFVGMTTEDVFVGDSAYRSQNLSSQRNMGVGIIRQTFDWSQIELSPGQYEFGFHDNYVATLAQQGMRVLPVLFRPPSFRLGRTSGRAACPPASLDSFGAFARALVARYGPNGSLWRERPSLPKVPIRSWQIWNEPSLNIYWCGKANAREYVQMLRVVGGAIKQADKDAEIVTAGIPPSKLKSAVPIDRYIKRMYRARARRYFDTMAINSYAKDSRELKTLMRSIRRIMNRRKDRRAPIWITELGWGDTGHTHRFIVGPEGQANRIRSSFKTIRRIRRKLRLRGVVYFTWRDAKPYPPLYQNMWGLHTGLLDENLQPKPAFWAFRDAAAALRP